jgi:transcriptional regulator with XRE-family HTH domain
MTTSDILTQIRTAKGMSRQELADMLNVRKSYIANIESGNYPFSLAKLIEIADILGYVIMISAKPKYTNGPTP